MEILPSDYQQMELSRFEKLFIRNAVSSEEYGLLLLRINPSMRQNDYMNVLITSDGIIFFSFFEKFDDISQFNQMMALYSDVIYPSVSKTISERLSGNKLLVGIDLKLKVAANMVLVFPKLNYKDIIENISSESLKSFVNEKCLFADQLAQLRTSFYDVAVKKYLKYPICPISDEKIRIQDNNINSILQRIAPEYVTIRVATCKSTHTSAGAEEEMLILTQDDSMVKAFRLDENQINIINKINKGEQLILACAGSGKSVLLIAKCFKAASMNPEKQFLITCYNDNLRSLYEWFIDKAGLRAKNVKCMTFHVLCKTLLANNGYNISYGDFDGWVDAAISRFNKGEIKERYYGIFIDEVQEFNSEWYKFCYNLLENKDSNDHLFVICGDKTQKLKNQQRHGKAPWNVGEGYPNYRGGNKNIRIEKNYRNCIEINEYINRFVSNAKKYLFSFQDNYALDPDMFLRGQSVTHGYGVKLKHLNVQRNSEEAKLVIDSINEIHDKCGIPYDEIAVVMYNSQYRAKIDGWLDGQYNLESPLEYLLDQEGIPFCKMYSAEGEWASRYGSSGGVKLIKFASVLGLDFRAAIVCGIKPLGFYNRTKKPDLNKLVGQSELFTEVLDQIHSDIRNLYVACTRAKEVLHIILSEDKSESEYVRLLEESEK